MANQITIVSPKQIHPLLASYLASMDRNPILTKSCTSGILSFLSEIVAGELSGLRPPPPTSQTLVSKSKEGRTGVVVDLVKRYHKAFKMVCYGFFISSPLSHILLSLLQKAFKGKEGSARMKVLLIIISNLFISPIQQSVYLIALSLINGSKSIKDITKTLKSSLWPVMKISWVVSTICMVIAQRFVKPELWVPFFTTVGTVVGTFINVRVKREMFLLLDLSRLEDKDGKVVKEEEK